MARELQTAIGLVAAEVGICIVPTSVQRLRRNDVVYRELVEQTITSPIIMSRRANDQSRELAVMSRVIIEAYREWGWKTPEGLDA
jgi:DNA-binding transcriptional LysR family regulator